MGLRKLEFIAAQQFHHRPVARLGLAPPQRQVQKIIVGSVEELVEQAPLAGVEASIAAREERLEYQIELEQSAAAAPAYAVNVSHPAYSQRDLEKSASHDGNVIPAQAGIQ